ncbi:hypothetical protein Scep_011237 [Stephania cephalantha]|uniref:Tyrosinase copper-binding domain-containing protein n=1 Tax=Stephania cephalantha TaxID=152367 RepID=A0AAP0P695_9MAGN
MLIGLGGLSTGLSALDNNRPATALPIQAPDLSRCATSTSPLVINCCPPSNQTIIQFQLPPSSSPIRVRPAAHLVDAAYISRYTRAVQLMKQLPANDPRNFMQQANVHCAYCNAAYEQVGITPRTQIQVHGSWLFFPWHRLYLYFYERILGNLIGEPTFTLPFWNWDAPDGMRMPSMYTANPATSSIFDRLRDANHQPPKLMDLDFGHTKPIDDSDQLIQNNLSTMTYTDPDWLNASFLFYDENRNLVRAKVGDALSISQLRYAYQDVPIPWMNARPTPKRPKGSRASNDLKKKAVKAADAFPRSLNNGLIRLIVKRPIINKSRTKKEKEEQPEVLVIEEIELDAGETVKFDVLVNDDDESTMPDKSEFAGSFVNVSHRHEGMEGEMKINTSLRLGITDLLEDLGVEDDDELVVTIVPRIGTQNVIIGEVKIELLS